MSLKGSFSPYISQRELQLVAHWQFVLKNTNMLFSETFDIMLMDCFGQERFIFRNQTLKAGQSLVFNFDTFDWRWCQDDYAAIIDSNNRILKKWVFHMREYPQGECPECHGTTVCSKCRGDITKSGLGGFDRCPRCGGTGHCITCDIPRRQPKMGGGPTGLNPV